MAETEPGSAAPSSPWDIEGATRTLHADSAERHDAVLGTGVRLTLVEAEGSPPVRLDLHPDHLVVRYRSALIRLEMLGVGSVAPEGDHVRLASGDADASSVCLVYPDGSLTMGLLGREAPARRREPSAPRRQGNDENPTTAPLPEAPGGATEETTGATEEKPQRVVLTGRVGRDPQTRTTANGHTVSRVPLAVHVGEETNWHTILFFDDNATKAAEGLAKGQMVTVIGYRHFREVTRKDGTKHQVEEIYAAGVPLPK